MINLEKYSGLPIQMKDDFGLEFGAGLAAAAPQVREFSALKNFLKDPGAQSERREIYYIFRDLAKDADREAIALSGLQFDLTVIPPGKLGEEFAKTAGHYHSYKPGTEVRYPEIYEVIYGKAFFVIQSASEDLQRLQEVYLIEAERGEKAVIPPGFGHVSVNPTDDVLVLANWQPRGKEGIYEPYEARSGAAYYVQEGARLGARGETSTDYEFAANLNYPAVPPLRHVRARELPQYDLRRALPMYYTGVKNFSALEFLTKPEEYLEELRPEKLFIIR